MLVDTPEGIMLQYVECLGALNGKTEEVLPAPYSNKYMSTTVPPAAPLEYKAADVFLRIKVEPKERNGKKWSQMKYPSMPAEEAHFIGKAGKWIGTKFGFYCNRQSSKNDSGWMQVDWITINE